MKVRVVNKNMKEEVEREEFKLDFEKMKEKDLKKLLGW